MTARHSSSSKVARIAPMAVAQAAEPKLLGWVSAATVAQLMEVSETTVWDWVKHGALPKPIKIRGVTRWRWSAVENYLEGDANGDTLGSHPEDDPILRASRGR